MVKSTNKIIKSILSVIMLSFLAMNTVAGSQHKVVEKTYTYDKETGLVHFETVLQLGENTLNRFTMHRVVKLGRSHKVEKPHRLKGALILLPGSASNFDTFLLGKKGETVAEQLALNGYEVYGYSPRTKGLSRIKNSPEELAVTKDWGIETALQDIEFIRKHAAMRHRKKPVIGGFSLGGIYSIAAVNQQPDKYAGIIILEAALYYDSPLRDLFVERAATLEFTLNNGIYVEDQQFPLTRSAVQLYSYFPSAISPFENSVNNALFLQLIASTPTDPPQGEAPGYTYAAGDFVNGFYYLDDKKILDMANNFNDLESIAVLRDYSASFAGDRQFTNNLSAFTQPIFSMQAGIGFGSHAEPTLNLFGSTDITRQIYPEFGHLDIIAHKNLTEIVSDPLISWLDNHINF